MSRSATRPAARAVPVGCNLVILRGRCRTEPGSVVVSTGEEFLSFDLLVEAGHGPRESVPVRLARTASATTLLDTDVEVVVIGRVRRRFFRVGGATATRTEVDADHVLGVRSVARIGRALATALEVAGVG